MRLHVESERGRHGIDLPQRFRMDGRKVEVTDNIDQWYGADHRYFKVRGDDGNLYILRLDERRFEWDVTLFQRPEAGDVTAAPPRPQRGGDGS